MERFTPLNTPSDTVCRIYAYKEGYFQVLVFYRLFYKRNRKHDTHAHAHVHAHAHARE